jgi:hypothetical protein
MGAGHVTLLKNLSQNWRIKTGEKMIRIGKKHDFNQYDKFLNHAKKE